MPRSDEDYIRRPSKEEFEEISEALGMKFNEKEREDYYKLVNDFLSIVEDLEDINCGEIHSKKKYDNRPSGYSPDHEEDPYNVWITKCKVEGAEEGPLKGKKIGLKDSIALAGYELTAGSSLLEGFVPKIDATIVTRLLDAGADIVGKLNMESFASSGTGDFSDYGTVINPYSKDHLPGGSSSGSGAAPALKECDISIGTDQAGSIMIPSAWCGVVGIKPTFGLVPYTGLVSLDLSIDHVGPMARTVKDVANALEVMAGEEVYDGLKMDPRQPPGVESEDYTSVLDEKIDGMEIGILEEGFDWDFSDQERDSLVRDAIEVYEDMGARTESVSIKLHRYSVPASMTVMGQGGSHLLKTGGVGTNHRGWYWSGLVNSLGKFLNAKPGELPSTVKRRWIASEYLQSEYNIKYYIKAKNLALKAEKRYNEYLEKFDLIVLPTTPNPPFEKAEDLDRLEQVRRQKGQIANTAMLNLTGHPAISLPCGKVNGLPVGMMLVGEHFDEKTLFKAAASWEDNVDWKSF